MDMNLDKEMSTRGLLDCINNKSMHKVLGSKWTMPEYTADLQLVELLRSL